MKTRIAKIRVILGLLYFSSIAGFHIETIAQEEVFPGADKNTPSLAQYFTWINSTVGGPTEELTLINMDFFQWMHDEYGMQLDIYAFDADVIDYRGPGSGSMKSERFKRNFPNSFDVVNEKAKSLGMRLGIHLTPDGFGDTPSEEKERIDMLVSLCRDYNFRMFKMDAPLRPEKQESFIKAMKACRKYTPDLIVINHRHDLGKAKPYVTTELWMGDESYIDVHMTSIQTATHHRVGALSRGLVPGLNRMMEDHGFCLSSCLDYWEDDLVMQAFNRCLLLAPEMYGSPWFLSDDEFPRLARLYNLHRQYRDIMIDGIVLSEEQYGKNAVSRGDNNTRLLTLSNLTWNSKSYMIRLDESIGLLSGERVTVVQYHPNEKVIGTFDYGETVPVDVYPFRSCLVMATTVPNEEPFITGCEYEMVRNVPGKDILINVMGLPGTRSKISLIPGHENITGATLDGKDISHMIIGEMVDIQFPGESLKEPWHRKIGEMQNIPVPKDAETLFEATCFANDNNALEVRSVERSGPTNIPQVQKARDAFFNQSHFFNRGAWDKFLFDGDLNTYFNIYTRLKDFDGGALRIDFGKGTKIDKLNIVLADNQVVDSYVNDNDLIAEVSADLKTWSPVKVTSSRKNLVVEINAHSEIQYFRLSKSPQKIFEIEGTHQGNKLDRSDWRASNLFTLYKDAPAIKAWSGSFVLNEHAKGSYLAIPLNGKHGFEGAYVTMRLGDTLIGAPDRSVSYRANIWENKVRPRDSCYTYYIPVTENMIGKPLEVVVLGFNGDMLSYVPEIWITAYPAPYESKELILQTGIDHTYTPINTGPKIDLKNASWLKDKSMSIEERIDHLMDQMTLEEKIAQTWGISSWLYLDGNNNFNLNMASKNIPYSVGQMTRPIDWRPGKSTLEMVRHINQIQEHFVTGTRLGIPVIFHEEAMHGLRVPDCTSFPQAIALACTWDPELVEALFKITAKEARRRGITQVLTPVLDLGLEPRWGRIEETFGEDPFLAAEIGMASVKGLQGDDPDRIPQDHTIATLKSFAAYSMSVGGLNSAPNYLSERFLRHTFFYPFKQAVQQSHARSIMASYNEIDGIPSHSSKWLLTDVLRGEWNFKGCVVSDYGAIGHLSEVHGVANNKTEAAALALNSGVDIELHTADCYQNIGEAINTGLISEEVLDRSVRRIRRSKFELGLFDHPYVDERLIQETTMDSKEGSELALKAAHESVVLLKNHNDLVPLDPDKLKKIAVIGPNADKELLGNYSSIPSYFVTVVEGIINKIKDKVEVVYSEGCKISLNDYYKEDILLQDTAEARSGIQRASMVAEDADVIILALGGNVMTSKEGGDRADLNLVGLQDELVDAMVRTGKPIIVLLLNGQPLDIAELADKVPVVFECWYLGQETGNAVADILFGDVNPSGKLCVSIPRSVGQVPVYYFHKNTKNKDYIFTPGTPLYPFGYGLSYTSFKYSDVRLKRNNIHLDDPTAVLVELTNDGSREGTEIVQLYVRDLIGSVTRPVKELKGFKRVTLAPGETKTIELPVLPGHLGLYDRDMDFVVEPGDFRVMVGGSSLDKDLIATTLTVID